jgi:UDP-N-acetylmuramoyl-L-alanyl-D-glutamate--2,6-diaminopimelate ligase
MPPTLETIAKEIGEASVIGDAGVRPRDVQQDSRKIVGGELFVARAGSKAALLEGFVRDAIEKGATAVMRDRDDLSPLSVPTIQVHRDAIRSALGVAASAVHNHPSYVVEVLGVTGTNGKTTITWLLGDALDRLKNMPDCAIVGTVGAKLGDENRATTHTTPEGDELARLLAWARDRGAQHAAIEVSSHALDQGRLAGTRVRAAAFTNLTQDHLDYHGTMERYFEAKKKLFVDMHPGASVVWIDDAWGRKLVREITTPLLRVGETPDADVRIVARAFDAAGIAARVATPWGEIEMRSRLVGAHNLANLCVALGVLLSLDVKVEDAARALGEAKSVRGRLEVASDPEVDDVTVLVDYAHTPDALARVLDATRIIAKNRLICVFGCGGDRDPTKRAPMGRAVVERADVAVVTSDNPRTEDPKSIVDQVIEGTKGAKSDMRVEIDRGKAIAETIAGAQAGDVIVVAGKGHEDYQIVGTEKRHFDDVEESQKALVARRAKSVMKGAR